MNEADTCRKYITPKLHAAGWDDDQIREQVTFTDGRIVQMGRKAKVNAVKVLQSQSQEELDTFLPSVLDRAFKGEL